jgi:hypothetical protein
MYSVKLYGSNTLVTPDSLGEANRTTILALGDLVTIALTCYGVYLDFADESEELSGGGSAITTLSRTRGVYSIPLEGIDNLDYPSFLSNLKSLLAKSYWYLEANTSISGSAPYTITSTGYMQVIGSIIKEETETVGRLKYITLTLKKRVLN